MARKIVEEGKKAKAVAVETISVSLFLFNSFNCLCGAQ
jgi:hypothetical protein